MTREESKAFYPILQAYAEGKVIECRTKPNAVEGTDIPNDWTEMKEIEFWENTEYRIKPEPKYRPFKDAEECWAEMLNHQPFGWVINKNTGRKHCITAIHETSNEVFIADDTWKDFYKIKKNYTFSDGLPFGVKVVEE